MTAGAGGHTSLPQLVGHIAEFDAAAGTGWFALGALWVVWLFTQHCIVLHGWSSARRVTRVAIATVLTVIMVASSVPSANAAFPEPAVGLPDLISDPPIIRLTKPVLGADGTPMLVMAFDGYLRNIGDGMLDLSGNPQVAGDVKQRIYNGDGWEPVSTPTITYETNDGHNHFHLVNAAKYILWDDARKNALETAAKVGFCLVDFEQVDETVDIFYGLDRFDYCAVDQSNTTDLRMGISPGWRDTYDAATTLQWVDVSNVAPGRYWVSAAIDPDDQIVESNETNNGDVFSIASFEVPGYRARPLLSGVPGEPITLKADPYGTTGEVAFVVVDPPSHGHLDVPALVDLLDPILMYEAEPGFIGTDSFTYYAHDISSAFPHEPQPVAVSVEVSATTTESGAAELQTANLGALEMRPDLDSVTTISTWQPVAAQLVIDAPPNLRWFSHGLPPGLRIDPRTGQINGTPTSAGQFESTIVGLTELGVISEPVPWMVETRADSVPDLIQLNNFSTPSTLELNVEIGFVRAEAGEVTFVGSGFPLGTTVATDQPRIIGKAQEVGVFDIQISRFVDGELESSVTVSWTVRPTTRPAFVI